MGEDRLMDAILGTVADSVVAECKRDVADKLERILLESAGLDVSDELRKLIVELRGGDDEASS